MLDERKEYMEYTFDLFRRPYACSMRLKNVTLKKGLSGTPRAMTVIARHSLFEEILEDSAFQDGFDSARIESTDAFGERPEEEQKERIRYAKDCVRLWCGDSLEIKPCSAEQEKLKDWLPRYLNALTKKTGDKSPISKEDAFMLRKALIYRITGQNIKKGKDAEKDFSELLTIYAGTGESKKTGPFYEEIFENEESGQNDFNKITYDRIIARALRQGPLKTYYLAAERDFEEDRASKIIYFKGNASGNFGKSDLLLKTTAAYLLADRKKALEMELLNPDEPKNSDAENVKTQRNVTGGPTEYPYRRVTWVDINNWMTLDGKIENSDLRTLLYHDKPVFEKLPMDMVSKVRPRNVPQESEYPGYLDCYGWRVLEESELDAARKAHPEWIFYEDQGSGKPLKRI